MIRSDKLIKKFDLQLFAEGDEPPKDDPKKIELTEEELQAKIDAASNAIADRRVTEAIKTHDAKKNAEFEKKLEETLNEHKRLEKLSEDEKEKELMKKAILELESREKALITRERLSDLNSILIDRKLPVMFAKSLLRETSELTLEAVNEFEKAYHEGIETGVNERLKGKPPGSGGTSHKEINPFDKATFNLSAQGKLYKENPEEAKRLKKIAK